MGHDGQVARPRPGLRYVRSATRMRIPGHVSRSPYATMFILPLLSLLVLPLVFASQDNSRQQLVKLAVEDNGAINLDPKTFDLLTSPKRDWSASVLFTALDKKRRCGPCR